MSTIKAKSIDAYIPWMFVMFFMIVISVDAIFMTTAIKTQTGVVTDKAYEIGLKYNDILKASDQQKKLGWSHHLNINEDGIIKFSLKDMQGNPVVGANILLLCFRPTQDGIDIKTELKETDRGIYTARPNFPADGLWQIFVTVSVNNIIYKANQDMIIHR